MVYPIVRERMRASSGQVGRVGSVAAAANATTPWRAREIRGCRRTEWSATPRGKCNP